MKALLKQAIAAFRAGDFAEAERGYRAAAPYLPKDAHHNLGVLYLATGRPEEAEAEFRAALQADPRSPLSRHSLGMLLLSQGRYAEGWPLYEARLEPPALNGPALAFEMPIWRGEDLTGRHILIVGEQGFGDQIMFARFARELVKTAGRVSYLVSPRVSPLFPGSTPAARGVVIPKADYYIPVGSLPHRLGITLETIPTGRYIGVSGSGGGGIGVVAKGNPSHVNDANRSLPPPVAQRLLRLGRNLEPDATGFQSFRQTAELIAGLDLVITVDTAVAHLAGAMHRPVWVLLPAVGTDWRWLRSRSDSPWYPTARLFRQRTSGRWEDILDEVEAAL